MKWYHTRQIDFYFLIMEFWSDSFLIEKKPIKVKLNLISNSSKAYKYTPFSQYNLS